MNNRLIIPALLALSSASAVAAPVYNAANGHYYEYLSFDTIGRKDWAEAKDYANELTHNGQKGYLATLTSQQEDDFVWNTLTNARGAFLGGFDQSIQGEDGKWIHQNWQWVTGEDFAYNNWISGEPNHWNDNNGALNETPDNEDYLMYWGWDINGQRWNDTNLDSSYLAGNQKYFNVNGIVVEYGAPVPVPGAVWLMATGLFGLMRFNRRQLSVSA